MMERICAGCGKAYWFAARWQHEKCVVVHAVVVHKDGSSRHGKYADVEARKAYRREWMKRRRDMETHHE